MGSAIGTQESWNRSETERSRQPAAAPDSRDVRCVEPAPGRCIILTPTPWRDKLKTVLVMRPS
jgi:hypothetical protein